MAVGLAAAAVHKYKNTHAPHCIGFAGVPEFYPVWGITGEKNEN